MNTNPIIIQPAQNPNSGNIPCYSFNISLYPCPDSSIVSTNGPTTNSGFQPGIRSFSNAYFPTANRWQLPQRTQLPPSITQNGRTISIPVPIPKSIYQCFQNTPPANINACTNIPGFSVRSSHIPAIFTNNNGQFGETTSFSKSPLFASSNSSRIPLVPPPPPPPPPQYFTSSSKKPGNFANKYQVETTAGNIPGLNQAFLEELRELNSKHRRYNLAKSYSFPRHRTLTPLDNNWKISSTKTENSNYKEERNASRRVPSAEKFTGGNGDSSESYFPLPEESSSEIYPCECEVCSKERIDEQNHNKYQEAKDVQVQLKESAKIPHIPSNIVWKQMNKFRNEDISRRNSRKFVDKATCPMHTGSVDYDSSPVWEFERRDGHKYHRTLPPSRTKEIATQCDLSMETLSSIPNNNSTEILWCRLPTESCSSTSLTDRSPYRVISDRNKEMMTSYADYTPINRQKTQTFLRSKISLNQDMMDQNETDYDEDIHDENSHEMEYSHLEKQNHSSPLSTTSSIVYRSHRPTFKEVMEYLDRADDDERLQLGLQCKSSMKLSNNPNLTSYSHSSQVKRNESNSNIYPVKYESRYKHDFQEVKPPKKVVPKRTLNFNQYKDSYTEVVCRRPPAEMFPEFPGPLDFPKNALGRVLTFLDSNYWQQVLDGFRIAVRLARHHPEVLCEDLAQVVWKSEKHLASLKSAISRAALASFTEFILHMGKAMEPFVDKMLGKILLKSMDCNKFLRWECRNVLNAIVFSFPVGRSLSCLESGFKHKSGMVRATVSIMLNKWVRKVGANKVMSTYADRILPMIISLLQERGWEARAGAKEALTLLFTHPNFMSILRDVVPYEHLIEASRRVKCIRGLMEEDCVNFRI